MSAVDYCLTDILSRMESSKLRLNVGKTDIISSGTKQQRNIIVYYFPDKILSNVSHHHYRYLSSYVGFQLYTELNLNWLLLHAVLFLLNSRHT